MNKVELIALTKELLETNDLSSRQDDLILLKKEYKRISGREEDSYYQQQQNDEFLSLYSKLAIKEPKLVQSSVDERKEIIELVKKLADRNDFAKASKDLDNYQEAFKKAGNSTKEQDDLLWAEFKEAKNAFIAKKKARYEEINKLLADKKAKKEEIIKKANEVLEIKNIKDANEKMDALMEEWKSIGFSGKDSDQKLWEEFSSIRKKFQEIKKEHHKEMIKLFEERANKKEKMIDDAKKLVADAYFDEKELKQIKKMREEFNSIGFAGKEKDDDLYQRFDAVIKKYFEEKKFYTL